MVSVSKGWAIYRDYVDLDGSHRPQLLGHGCFGWPRPKHLRAYVTAAFDTRREARAAIRELREIGYSRLSARRVHIRVSVPA